MGWQELCKGDAGVTADGCGVLFGGKVALELAGGTSCVLRMY